MNPWCYLIMLGWAAGGVFSWKRTGIWLPVLVAVAWSGLAAFAVALKNSVLPPLPGPQLRVGTTGTPVAGAVWLAWALLRGGIRGRKVQGK